MKGGTSLQSKNGEMQSKNGEKAND